VSCIVLYCFALYALHEVTRLWQNSSMEEARSEESRMVEFRRNCDSIGGGAQKLSSSSSSLPQALGNWSVLRSEELLVESPWLSSLWPGSKEDEKDGHCDGLLDNLGGRRISASLPSLFSVSSALPWNWWVVNDKSKEANPCCWL